MTDPRCPECGTRFHPDDDEQEEGDEDEAENGIADDAGSVKLSVGDRLYVVGVWICHLAVFVGLVLAPESGGLVSSDELSFSILAVACTVSVLLAIRGLVRIFGPEPSPRSFLFWVSALANLTFVVVFPALVALSLQ